MEFFSEFSVSIMWAHFNFNNFLRCCSKDYSSFWPLLLFSINISFWLTESCLSRKDFWFYGLYFLFKNWMQRKSIIRNIKKLFFRLFLTFFNISCLSISWFLFFLAILLITLGKSAVGRKSLLIYATLFFTWFS